MLSNIFESILTEGTFTSAQFAVVTLTSLVCGFIIAAGYSVKNKCSRSFAITLIMLPAIVELVIILVNGNIGAGVAVAGAFSLVRFRSAQGRGEEITGIFLAMAAGLATGMGYIFVAIIFAVIVSVIELLLRLIRFGGGEAMSRKLRITIPEDLDFEGRFDDIFKNYLKRYELIQVKTCNMGTMYRLDFDVVVKPSESVKEFMDKLRERNGNLEIMLNRCERNTDEL